jgi:Fe-S cluster biogenesis protein NfuA/nitrite reductase/ring-hydroxylating ferredoxin subunit
MLSELASPGTLVADVERALEQVEAIADPDARALATSLVQGVVELYGAGLERIVEVLAAHDSDGAIAMQLCQDELVSHLLLLHGLHPRGLYERISEALAEVRPYLESHGGDVELLGIDNDATVRLRLSGSCDGCPSSAMTLKLAIEDAIHKLAPEIEEVVVQADPGSATVGLRVISVAPGFETEPEATWTTAGTLVDLAPGRPQVKPVAGEPVLFLKLGARIYGYASRCPACQASLDGCKLHGVALVCPGCASRFDAIRAGRCLDAPELYLDPVPLLVGADGLAKVALARGG